MYAYGYADGNEDIARDINGLWDSNITSLCIFSKKICCYFVIAKMSYTKCFQFDIILAHFVTIIFKPVLINVNGNDEKKIQDGWEFLFLSRINWKELLDEIDLHKRKLFLPLPFIPPVGQYFILKFNIHRHVKILT